jgi:hypothetical protein
MYIEGRLSLDNPQYGAALEMVGAGNSAAMGAKRVLTVQQMSDRTYRIYMALEAPEAITRPGGNADLADLEKARAAMLKPGGYFDGCSEHLRAFIAAAEGPWRPWPLYRLDPDIYLPAAEGGSWTHVPGITLLGDAAHLATPNGEGVNQAMYDALVLFDSILSELRSNKSDEGNIKDADEAAIDRAVTTYEADMFPRARHHINDGIQFEANMFVEDAVERLMAMFNDAS